jgi:transposase
LADAAIKPHHSRYWLNPKIDDPVQHAADIREICDVYAKAAALDAEGVHVISCDEKTSIQALERDAPTRPMQPGMIERREFEYVRHGTTCLIANFDVVTGEIVAPTLGPTRDEEDFALHIRRTTAADPSGRWLFVLDNLTTHVSETLVRLVVEREGLDVDLGAKGKCGILKNVASRKAFLTDGSRRIRFVFTPKHCSWLNQVEIWFSVLARRVLKRGDFISVDALEQKILAFIAYFNRVLAKPFRWTYAGRPLAA